MITGKNGGHYRGIVSRHIFSETRGKGTPQLALYVNITNIVDGDEITSIDLGEKIVYMYLTPGTIKNVMSDLRSLGWAGSSFRELHADDAKAHSFEGVEVPLKCTHEAYLNGTKERWELGYRQFEAKLIDKSKVANLDAMFADALKVGAKASAPSSKPAVRDDDGQVF